MVKVPTYERNVSLRPDYQQGIDVRATPEAFGADIGRGMQRLGQGLDQFADAMRQVQEIEDTARAKEADNAFAGWARERMYGEGGFMTLSGKAAVDGRSAFEKEAEQKRMEFGKGLTPGAAQAYDRASQARVQSIYQQSIVHTAQERKRWVTEASAARLDTFAEDALAVYNNPAQVDKNIAAGQAEIRQQAQLLGWDADTTTNREKEYISSVRLNVALRTLADDPVAAKAYFDAHKDQITGPHQFKFEEAVKVPLRNENVKRNTDKFFQTQGAAAAGSAAEVIRQFEGFRTQPYWDTNAYRVGFGSDTITKADGTVVRVQPGMTVSRADAERDLQRRINTEFVPGIIKMVGQDKWDRLPSPAKAALASVAYNYGSLPFKVANAVVTGDVEAVAAAVESLKGHNDGVNANRRMREAAIIRGMTGLPISQAAAMPGFGEVEEYLRGINDPEERELTRKSIYSMIEAQSKAQKAQREQYQAQAFNLIETQNISPFSLPPEITTAIGMQGMSELMTYWEKRSRGEQPKTDDQLLYDMRTLYATNPEEFAKQNLLEYKNKLSPEDYKMVEGWRQDALTNQRKAREEGLTLTTAFSQAETQLAAVGLSTAGKTGSDREETARRIAQFQNSLAAEMEAFKQANDGKRPNQMEIQSMINRLLLPLVIKQPQSLFGVDSLWPDRNDDDHFLFETGGKLGDLGNGIRAEVSVDYSKIPVDQRIRIEKTLETILGYKPSEKQVEAAYAKQLSERK